MIMAFLLVVHVDGRQLDTSEMHFRDIHRCTFCAEELEKSANLIWSGNKVIHAIKLDAWCKPVTVSPSVLFWDWKS